MARQEFANGRDRAAAHLLGAVAREYIKSSHLNAEEFNVKLESISDWIFQEFHPRRDLLDTCMRHCQTEALRKRTRITGLATVNATTETTMEYPPEFSSRAKALVEGERLRAGRDLEGYRKEQKRRPDRPQRFEMYNHWTEPEQDLQEYVLRVFLVFAAQACALGQEGVWSVDVVRAKSSEFLRVFTIQAFSEKGHAISRSCWISEWGGAIKPELQRAFEKWDQWRDFEDLLLKLADFQAEVQEPLPGQPTVPTVRNRPGPKPDYETASRVAAIIRQFGGNNWRSKLDEICCELDEAKIPCPRTWKGRGHDSWFDCLTAERVLVVKAIEHRLESSASSFGETLS